MSECICNLCKKPCSVLDVDQPIRDENGATVLAGRYGVSACCRTSYTWELSSKNDDPWGGEPF